MTILDKLIEKKDLRTYIVHRIKFLEQEREEEIRKAPELERGFYKKDLWEEHLNLINLRNYLKRI